SSLRGGRDGARPSPSVTATSGCLLLSLSASPLLSRAAPPPCEVIGKLWTHHIIVGYYEK
ncbi:MAG: hypothetical protein IKR48_12330, partial [Kiritimatiellae bacterium]|nr:hypothetical protein [Kiritimatiellia bacterium]